MTNTEMNAMLLKSFFIVLCNVKVRLVLLCQFKSLVGIDHYLSANLGDGIVDNTAFLDTAGRRNTTAEYLGDTGNAVNDMFLCL